jgi:hypothetical protein
MRQKGEGMAKRDHLYTKRETRNFMVYWQPDSVEAASHGNPVTVIGGEQFSRTAPDDVLWIVTVRDGGLRLANRFVVGRRFDSQRDAERHFGRHNLWKATYHLEAAKGTATRICDIDITSLVTRMRFAKTKRDRLILTERGVNPQQLQTMRMLTGETAALLADHWSMASARRKTRNAAEEPKTAEAANPRRRGHLPAAELEMVSADHV